jgi:molybdopterin converting factor small subunit
MESERNDHNNVIHAVFMAELGELIKKHINERMNNQEKQHVRRLEVMFQTQKERLERHKWIIDMKNEEINNLKKKLLH